LTPATFGDSDTTDAAIQVVTKSPSLAPTALADSYSMAPNTANFTTTMTATGLAVGVLGNDTATTNGPMNAMLTGAGVTTTNLAPASSAISTASEVNNVVTITTATATNLVAGEGVTISGVGTSGYNGYFAIATVLSGTQFTYTTSALGLSTDSSGGGTASSVATTVYSEATSNGTVSLDAQDGSFSYTPTTVNFLGTDTFTYEAVDAVSNTASANTTVSITVGGI